MGGSLDKVGISAHPNARNKSRDTDSWFIVKPSRAKARPQSLAIAPFVVWKTTCNHSYVSTTPLATSALHRRQFSRQDLLPRSNDFDRNQLKINPQIKCMENHRCQNPVVELLVIQGYTMMRQEVWNQDSLFCSTL